MRPNLKRVDEDVGLVISDTRNENVVIESTAIEETPEEGLLD